MRAAFTVVSMAKETAPGRFAVGLDARLRALHLSRYKLAQLSGLHVNTINSWWHTTNGPSMESLAKIGPHLNMSQAELWEMAGLSDGQDRADQGDNLLTRDVQQRCRNMVDVAEALEDIPEEEWLPHLTRILDRTEAEIRDMTSLLVRASQAPLPNSGRGDGPPRALVAAAQPRQRVPSRGRIMARRNVRRKYSERYICHSSSSGFNTILMPSGLHR